MCMKHAAVFLYLAASNPCILVLTTSIGVLPKTLAAPAIAPKAPTNNLGHSLFLSPPLYVS